VKAHTLRALVWAAMLLTVVLWGVAPALAQEGADGGPAATDAPVDADPAPEKDRGAPAAPAARGAFKPWERRWRQQFPPTRLAPGELPPSSFGQRAMSLVGLLLIMGVAVLLSNDRKHLPWRLAGIGVALQIGLGVLLLKTGVGRAFFDLMNDTVTALLAYTDKGSDFLFGDLLSYDFGRAAFAFKVLPTIIFFSALMTVLYYLGVMQFVVRIFAKLMQSSMGTSGAETLSAAGNIFVGQTEAPLLIKPFVGKMTESELMAVMTGGFATVAGGVMAAYVSFLDPFFKDVAGHLLTASIMSAPAALVCAKLMVPEAKPEASETYGTIPDGLESEDVNVIDAAARGAGEGLKLAFNVGAMLLAFIALIALLNDGVGYLCHLLAIDGLMGFEGEQRVSLEFLLGKLLSPLAFVMGVPWEDAEKVGALFGMKTVLNEFVAYLTLAGEFAKDPSYMQPRSLLITCYALCGFANFSSIAIQIGGISGIAPERRSDLARLGLRAMIAGSLAAFMTGTVAGMLL
jgi:concentrative nucleoside transporter, CNT family